MEDIEGHFLFTSFVSFQKHNLPVVFESIELLYLRKECASLASIGILLELMTRVVRKSPSSGLKREVHSSLCRISNLGQVVNRVKITLFFNAEKGDFLTTHVLCLEMDA